MYLNGYSDLVQLKNICPRFLDMKIVVEYMSSMWKWMGMRKDSGIGTDTLLCFYRLAFWVKT